MRHSNEGLAAARSTATVQPDEAPFQPGSLVGGRYRLESLIGRGGMAAVFRARDERCDAPVAVKVFHSDPPGGDTDADRQSDEVQILRTLEHPHIVRALDAGGSDAERHAFLVLELVPGQTLAQRIAAGPLPRRQVAEIGRQIASALAHIHARHVVHRDIKPANILLETECGADLHAKLTDFGVARVLDGTRLTMFGMTVGTANYLSPEQALGQDVTARSDIYCLGLTLLEALTGRKAFPGHGVEAALSRLLHDPGIPAALGPGWSALLEAMTNRDPNFRPSAADVERLLEDVIDDVPVERFAAPAELVLDALDEEILGPLAGFLWQAADEVEQRSLRSRLRRRNREGRAGRRRLQPAA